MAASSLITLAVFVAGLVGGAVALYLVMRLRTRAAIDSAVAGARCEMQALSQKVVLAEADAARLRQEVVEIRSRLEEASRKSAEFEGKFQSDESQIVELKARVAGGEAQMRDLNGAVGKYRSDLSALEMQLGDERKHAEEKLKLLSEARDQLKAEFQNLANTIFDEKTKKFSEQSKANLDLVLDPLRTQLGDFRKRVDEVYANESKDRGALSEHIKILTALNQQVSKETQNLTTALKGESKTQGNWGEMILERALELSGLKKGVEYEVQVYSKSEDGKLQRPDVVVHLPESRDIIVDSKVSLTAFERLVSAVSDADRESALASHLQSVRGHIESLSGKSYDVLSNIKTLDYVLMFMPIEAAFIAAIQKDPKLFEFAYEKRVIIVSPSTLLVTLRTIQNLWQSEYQSRNALEIADRAAGLFDKFVTFADTLLDVKKAIGSAADKCDSAVKLLSEGKGNIVGKIEAFRKMGVKPRKALPESLIESAEYDEEVV